MAIKTRTRNFVKYLRNQFADRYEFFIENAAEGHDIIHVGDRNKFRNFEIHVDYLTQQVRLFGVRVCQSMADVEAYLGKVRKIKNAPQWAKNKILKVKKQVEKLMTKKNLKKSRMQANEQRSKVMSFSF